MRKLASIRRVKDTIEIPEADRIEIAQIDGWQCVVKKGEFSKDDLGVYFEIDSFLPMEDKYSFLGDRNKKKLVDGTEGYRLKTIRLRGVLSQGLLLPVKFFNELDNIVYSEGTDVTQLLNVKLYEPPVPARLQGDAKGSFPTFIPKTDQERIQNFPEIIKLCNVTYFEETEKLDGTSCTYYFYDGEVGVCSRNLNIKEGDNTYWRVFKELGLEEHLRIMGKNIALQGEIIGEGIQKNPYGIKGHRFHVFDVYDIDYQRYYYSDERVDLIFELQEFVDVRHVPVTNPCIQVFSEFTTMNEVLAHAEGKSMFNDVEREGLVYKALFIKQSFKVINNKYLL